MSRYSILGISVDPAPAGCLVSYSGYRDTPGLTRPRPAASTAPRPRDLEWRDISRYLGDISGYLGDIWGYLGGQYIPRLLFVPPPVLGPLTCAARDASAMRPSGAHGAASPGPRPSSARKQAPQPQPKPAAPLRKHRTRTPRRTMRRAPRAACAARRPGMYLLRARRTGPPVSRALSPDWAACLAAQGAACKSCETRDPRLSRCGPAS